MTKRTIRICGLGAGVVLGLAVLAFGTFAVMLMRGPIHVSFLNGYAQSVIQSALTGIGDGITVHIEDSILAWDAEQRGVDFRAVNAALFRADGEVLLEIPQISIRLSGWALLRGRLAPAGLEMTGARVRLYRGREGGFVLALASLRDVSTGAAELDLNDLVGELVADAERNFASRYLQSLSITGSRFEYEDPERGRIFTADDVSVTFARDGDALTAEAALRLLVGELVSTVDLTAALRPGDEALEATLSFENLPPGLLGQIEPGLRAFTRLHVPLSGTLTTRIGRNASIERVAFDVQSGAGWIAAPELGVEPVPVSFATLKGRIEDNFRLATLEDLHFDFDGAIVDVSGIIFSDRGTASTQLDVKASAVRIEEALKFLRPSEQPSISKWVKEHIFSGTLSELDARLSAAVSLNGGGMSLQSLNGRAEFSDVTGKYIKSMTPLVGVVGTAVMNNRSMTIGATAGRFEGTDIIIEDSVLEIDNFSDPALKGELRATMSGPTRQAFALINEEPLHLLEALDIDPAAAAGTTTAELTLTIPMRGQVGLRQLDYRANATLREFVLANDTFGRPIADGMLSLTLDRKRMVTDGTLDYGGLPVTVTWTRPFGAEREYRSRFQFAGTLGARERRLLGLQAAPYLTGPIRFELDYTTPTTGLSYGSADLDLTDADVRVPSISFVKEPGVAGSTGLDFVLGTDGVVAVSDMVVEAGGLFAQGSMSLNARDPGFLPVRVTFDRFRHASTDVHGSLDVERVPAAGGGLRPAVELFVVGDALDLRGAISGVLGVRGGGIGVPLRIVVGDPTPVGTVMISDTARLDNLIAVVEHDGSIWRNVHAVADLGDGGRLNLDLADEGTFRRLTVTSGDAGQALKDVGWLETIDGGTMNVTAILPNPPSTDPVVGQATIEDFDLVGAPLMARLLTLASFKGLTRGPGDDLEFDDLSIDFCLLDDMVEFPHIRAEGDVYITARGTMNRADNVLDMSGEVAPATTVNRLMEITTLPGVRDLFGESIFAASFRASGSASQPELTVNPLSVLAPLGITRRLLEALTGGRAELRCALAQAPPVQQ